MQHAENFCNAGAEGVYPEKQNANLTVMDRPAARAFA